VTDGQLATVIVAAVVYLVWAVLVLLPLGPIQPVTDPVVVRHGWLMRGLAILCSFVPAAIVVLAFVTDAQGEDIYAIIGLIVFMSLLVSLLLLEAVRVRLVVSDEGVQLDSPWRGQRFIFWKDVSEVRFSQSAHWFILYARDGRKIRASTWLAGVIALVHGFRKHLPKVVWENAYIGIEFVDHGEPERFNPHGRKSI
jgi:hypothetical protein